MFENWFSSILSVFQIAVVLLDLAVGLDRLFTKKYTLAALDFVGVVSIIAIMVVSERARRKCRAAIAEQRRAIEHHERILAMSPAMIDEAMAKAFLNLELVMRAVGATECPEYGPGFRDSLCVIFKAGAYEFVVRPNRIYRKFVGGDVESKTCYYPSVPMPAPEIIASALLHLRHDPTIYDRWYRQDGMYGL